MIKITNENRKLLTLRAIIGGKALDGVIAKDGIITDFIDRNEAHVYFEKKLTVAKFKKFAEQLATAKRSYQIDLKTFITTATPEQVLVKILIETDIFVNKKGIYNVKTKPRDKEPQNTMFGVSSAGEKVVAKTKLLATTINWVRNFQTMPPNELNSVVFADQLQAEFKQHKNITFKVLGKQQTKALKMGLFHAVNRGSAYEGKVVVIEYKGNAKSPQKTAMIGKGIMFDSGGMNIKTGKYMLGMKYDMSGAAIVAGVMKAIAELKPPQNIAAVLPLTDNMVSNQAGTPDAVYTAMNGKTVEVNNTDAEGRLVMADALTYAAQKLNATRLVDIATLTGAIGVALGETYTGVWSTTDQGWKDVKAAAKRADELVWRLPLHDDYFRFMKGSKVADMFNTDYSGKGGSSSAAMFLTQFNEGKEHIHLDIAGTAEIKGECMGPMVKTLVELVSQ